MRTDIEGSSGDVDEYLVDVNFAGYVGATETYTVSASNEDDAIEEAIDLAVDDLSVDDVEDLGGDEWNVTIGFNGFIDIQEIYTVEADDGGEAVELAIDEAKWDLSGEIVRDDDEESDDY